MKASQIRSSLSARWRHPGYWLAGLVLLSAFLLLAWVLPGGAHKWSRTLILILSVFAFVPALIGSPIPWQWSGDEQTRAAWWRGSLQCLGYTAAWGLIFAAILLIPGWAGSRSWSFFWGCAVSISLQFLIVLVPAGIVIARMESLKRETQEAQARAREVRWMSHRGSFSPGLLFSNLKHLADLADRDAQATEQGLVDLAELYRRGLIEAEHPLISLSGERDLAEQYLALERGRWGDALVVRWHLEPDLEYRLLPPLLLFPLFESLLAPGPEAGALTLNVFVLADPTFLILRFQRMQEGTPPSESALNAMLQRMHALSGEGGSVELSPKMDGWELLLRIPSPEKRP